jgi:hypothetical protein
MSPSARQCHDKTLPYNLSTSSLCVNPTQAATVFRLGQLE